MRSRLDLSGIVFSELDFSGLEFSGLKFGGLEFGALDLSRLEFRGLEFRGLEFCVRANFRAPPRAPTTGRFNERDMVCSSPWLRLASL